MRKIVFVVSLALILTGWFGIRGYPLYYWFQDMKAGDTAGNKVNDVWFVIDPGAFPPAT